MQEIIKVGIVEDQVLFREGIKSILEAWERINFVFESPDGFSMLDRLQNSQQVPDVMLVDLTLPKHGNEEFNGWTVVQVLKEYYPEMKILILSAHDERYLIAKLIEEGANGYLVKESTPQEVYDAIVAVFERGSYFNERSLKAIQSKLTGKLKTPKTHEALTRREIEVLQLICQQKTAEEIGNELFISTKTVNGHRNNLLQKTGARNISGLVMYAIKHNIVEAI
ncbi:response regulator [Kordia jejudonensis]|uniref:response regulator n=1 Tax=Kordia jejudonensis TaxID=1348245 RepID=UPI0006291E78|nr:response regulator transcription factor [Kordia jejudonensis]